VFVYVKRDQSTDRGDAVRSVVALLETYQWLFLPSLDICQHDRRRLGA
jgi:hypothetical protein